MSEGELLQAAQATWANGISMVTVEITLLTAYIIMAYMVGKDLSKSQVTIVNTLYVLLSMFAFLSIYILSMAATEMGALSIEMSEQRTRGPQLWVGVGVVGIFTFCLIGSLKFMWDVRHPKTE